MGLKDWLQRQISKITGKKESRSIYRMHTTGVGLPSDGAVLYKHTGSSPVETPPGVIYYKDANGKMAWIWERDLYGLQHVIAHGEPTDTEGVIHNSNAHPTKTKWHYDTAATSGANQILVAKDPDYAIELEVIFGVTIISDVATPESPGLTFQDENDLGTEGCSGINGGSYEYDVSGTTYWGSTSEFGRGTRCKTVSKNLDLEADLVGTNPVGMNYRWRYVVE